VGSHPFGPGRFPASMSGMPLKRGKSAKVKSQNIAEMRRSGMPEERAVAAALRMARETGRGKKKKKSK
jgi:hypothetical protein